MSFKAIVPAGFMPDMDALRQGTFRMTICSAYGASKILVDSAATKIAHHSGHTASHDMPMDHSSHEKTVIAMIALLAA